MQVKHLPTEIDFARIRQDFPLLQFAKTAEHPIVYLDTAASAQKPQRVLDAMSQFYQCEYANIHRGIYQLSAQATMRYEAVRDRTKKFVHARPDDSVIFVSGTTEAINLVATSYGRHQWRAGDEIILSEMEHHANIVPWYLLSQELGIKLQIIPVQDDGQLDMEVYAKLFSARTKLVAISHVSNALGIVNPIKEMTAIAHAHNVPVLVDGAQAVSHIPVDLQKLDCDFYVFSAHKLYGPTGIGALVVRSEFLECMQPYQGGGDMIETVAFDHVTFAKGAQKFEAGTPHIAGVIGMSAAMDYVSEIGMHAIYAHEQGLLQYAERQLLAIDGLRMIGTAHPKVGVISFVIEGLHPHDIGTVLDAEGIAVRAGHHCAMPLMTRFDVPATVRMSLGIYNQESDIDKLVAALQLAKRLLS